MTKRETELLAKATTEKFTWLEDLRRGDATILVRLEKQGLIETMMGHGDVAIRKVVR